MCDQNGVFESGEVLVYDGRDLVYIFDQPPGGGPGSSSLTHRFLPDAATDAVFADEDALGEILWYLSDHQGTVRDAADYDAGTDTTTVVNHLAYSAFGAITSESDADHTPVVAYTGMYRDPATGLQKHGARWYDPAAGQWLSEDPIGFAAGDTNLRRYVGNGSTNWVDPSGLDGVHVTASGDAYWIIEYDTWLFPNANDRWVPIGQVDPNDRNVIVIDPKYGGGQVLLEELEALADSFWDEYPVIAGLPAATQDWYITSVLDRLRFHLPPAHFAIDPFAGGGQAPVKDKMLTYYGVPQSKACGMAGALIVSMLQQVAKDLALEMAGGRIIGVAARGGKLFVEVAEKGVKKTYGYSKSQVTKALSKLGGCADDVDLDDFAKQLDAALPKGQLHHPISKRVARALQDHPILRGHYKPRDPRFTTRAIDGPAHTGYQSWHIDLDSEVIEWLHENATATPEQFEAWLRRRYNQPDLLRRFPNGL